jgi:uncharacterized protein (TIGR00255 family)
MTAYGRGEGLIEDIGIMTEIKSVNHRYRDISLRIPRDIQFLESNLRSLISKKVARGRIEVSIQLERSGEKDLYDLELNTPLLKSYLKVFKQLADYGFNKDIRMESLCLMKDMLIIKPKNLDQELIKPEVENSLMKALDAHDQMRRTEGKSIKEDFVTRLGLIQVRVEDIKKRAPAVVEEYRKRLNHNLQQLIKGAAIDIEDRRLLQEIAIFSERSDITEELIRIKSHLNQYSDFIEQEEPVGRKLDFLLQEINREINTIGSKAGDALISKAVVDIKGELEKLREQVQNIE